MSRRGLALVAATAVASGALVGTYVALGGGDYTPAPVADPCVTREWRDPSGATGIAEQIVLSALDGAACDLHVSRERLAVLIAQDTDLTTLAAEFGLDEGELEDVLRQGLRRAVQDAEDADAINGVEAFLLRQAVERIPIGRLLEAYRDGDLNALGGLLG